jgi:hypothetical protein
MGLCAESIAPALSARIMRPVADLTSHPLQNQLKVYISHLILGLKYQRNRGTRKTGAVLRQLRVKR